MALIAYLKPFSSLSPEPTSSAAPKSHIKLASHNFQELGTKWRYTEKNGWEGEWIREKDSDTFFADFHNRKTGEEPRFKVKIISYQGGIVSLRRYDSINVNNYCSYMGKISDNRNSIEGNAICPNGGNIPWYADIEK